MLDVKTTFKERANEIETYYTFLELYIATNRDENLNKILKSNLILMLYNLVESSISNAIEEIHNNIHARKVSFDVLKQELREDILKRLKKINPKDFVESVNDLAIDIVKKSFNKDRAFSGNVDSREILKLSKVYGFSDRTVHNQTKGGQCLLQIKNKRNDLAHGVFSFSEVGKDYSVQDLEKMKNETVNYLEQILANIESCLTNQGYKK